jgi:mono/diheme cytochrome c family protein
MADFIGFARGLRDAFKDTLNDEQKFNRFANKVLDQPNNEQVAELHKAVEKYSQALSGWVDRADNATPYGFGRLDAFNILVNEIVGTALDHPENYRKADAPVSYPPLWQTPNMDWVQWNGSAVEPLSRNTGEVLGVFGELDLKEGSSTFGHSSAQIRDLHALEEYLKELQPPKWPAEFGELDPDKVKRGKEVYDSENCASCHDAGKYTNKNGRELIKTTLVPLDVIKTDPTMATDFATRTANPGPFKPYFGGKDQVPLPAMIGPAVKTVIKEGFAREKIPPSEVPAYTDHREERQRTLQELKGYKAPQLQGVWATAPYLHNGSVPTLDDLFKPSSQRPSNFMVGSREFDPDKVGFETEKGKSNFDTTLKGNSNLGHEGPGFGTELNKDDREALIAYLKSL